MGINVENILRVADAIETHSIPDLGFNMSYWHDLNPWAGDDKTGRNCGTTACIAGWAVAVAQGSLDNVPIFDICEKAQSFLGLSDNGAYNLFERFKGDPSTDQAVAVLRHLAATGEVDWTISSPEAA